MTDVHRARAGRSTAMWKPPNHPPAPHIGMMGPRSLHIIHQELCFVQGSVIPTLSASWNARSDEVRRHHGR